MQLWIFFSLWKIYKISFHKKQKKFPQTHSYKVLKEEEGKKEERILHNAVGVKSQAWPD